MSLCFVDVVVVVVGTVVVGAAAGLEMVDVVVGAAGDGAVLDFFSEIYH